MRNNFIIGFIIFLVIGLVAVASLSQVGEFHWKNDLREQYDFAYNLGYATGYGIGKLDGRLEVRIETHREAKQPESEPATIEYGLGPNLFK